MGRRKPELIQNLTITGTGDKGKGVGKTEDGKVIFIEGLAVGDIVDVWIKRKKKGVFLGELDKIITYSKDRVNPQCEHFEFCGGCKWQHIDYAAQLNYKNDVVLNALQRIGKVPVDKFLPIVGADDIYYYRNKLEFTFSNKRWLEPQELNTNVSNVEDVLGFHRAGAFDKIIDIKQCHLQKEPTNEIRNFVKEFSNKLELEFFDLRLQEGFLRNIIFRITELGELMITVIFYKENKKDRESLLDALIKNFLYQYENKCSLNYAINPKRNDSLFDIDTINYYGKPYIIEQLKNIQYQISPKSFFQTNSKQAEKLYDIVVDFADFKGSENVYDLYTGTGSIACYVAQYCKQVVGIEEIQAAIDDAHINAQINQIENTVFYAGDVKDILTDEFAQQHGKPDILITDPPRAGMNPKVVDMLLQLESPKIVYVSCNPATQARDLNLLSEKYDVIKVQPVDMFPHTYHIESVALLHLKS